MDVVEIAVAHIHPAPWNPNRMSVGMKRKLAACLRREGIVQPLVVRPHPSGSGVYELIGGHQRFEVLRDDLGAKSAPCVVVHLDDRRAKALAINLNGMTGQMVPSMLARVIHDLTEETPVSDLAQVLPFTDEEIEDFLKTLQIPEGVAESIAREVDEAEKHRPDAFVAVLDSEERAVVDEAIKRVTAPVGVTRNPRARGLVMLARHYLACKNASDEAPRERGAAIADNG